MPSFYTHYVFGTENDKRWKPGEILHKKKTNAFFANLLGETERLLSGLEKKLYGYPFLSPLFMNQNQYEVGKEEIAAFERLFWEGLEEYQNLMPYLEQLLGDKKGDTKVKTELLRLLKNRSYHTGKDCGA